MERFVRAILVGGVALVVGLWVASLVARWSALWLLGTALVLVGVAGLAVGIHDELDY